MTLFDEAVRAVAVAGGWNTPVPDQAGVYSFSLKGGSDFSLFSLDGRECVVRGEVMAVPDEAQAREDVLTDVARRQVGVCRRRGSVLALEPADGSLAGASGKGEKLVLFRRIRLEAGASAAVSSEVRDFLNDFDWWKAALNGHATMPSDPVGNAFPGGFGMGGLR